MSRFTTIFILMLGLSLAFYFTGLLGNTPNSLLLDLLLNPERINEKPLMITIIASISAVGIFGAVLLGFVTSNIQTTVMTTVVIALFNIGWDFLAVISKVMSVNKVLGILLFAPFIVMYGIVMVDFWRGTDT